MVTSTRYVTADELLHMSEDGYRYELVRGELRKSMPPGHRHSQSILRICLSMGSHVITNDLGMVYPEGGFLIGPDHVCVPDVAFVNHDRWGAADEHGYFPGPPDLAIEILSPSNRPSAIAEKIDDYLEAGTKVVIIANPRSRSVSIHSHGRAVVILTESDTLEVPEVIPGWSMSVSRIFD